MEWARVLRSLVRAREEVEVASKKAGVEVEERNRQVVEGQGHRWREVVASCRRRRKSKLRMQALSSSEEGEPVCQ